MKISELILSYLRHLVTLGQARLTVRGAKYGLRDFSRFLTEMQVVYLSGLTREVILEYQRELAFRLTAKGTLLTLRSQSQLLGVVKNFCRYLCKEEYLLSDPAEAITLPKKPRRLPKVILSTAEIRKVLGGPDLRSNTGYRNRIVLEILYDTGIRRAEMANIKTSDLDLDGGYIHIRSGKGDKDRVVPLSQRVCNLTRSYLLSVRPALLHGEDDGALILNRWGRQMNANGIWAIVKRSEEQSGIRKNISPHTFRHTCATHMMNHGAPIRHVQELLGHESLESTQIYTRVTINDLKEIHARCHPGESMPNH
jgi:integrase/recombinase XerD